MGRRDTNLIYDNGEKLYMQKSGKGFSGNKIVEMLESPVSLISGTDQRYEAIIDYTVREELDSTTPRTELKVNPGALDYYLEPGQTAEMRKTISGELRKNGEKIPIEVRMEPELYRENHDTVLGFNYSDPKVKALAEDSATLTLNNHPFIERAT
ncbi:MAG: hypothetical protein BRC29_04960 [Nanohaloarchaea archaeon SW_7_43_1]|nr:MAG: hypothetical protein BRC29_04960 [Nanohaloarchaea archaeon SW_7_43_1]